MTCTHEADCDDMPALISELVARGETWEIQFRRRCLADDGDLSHAVAPFRPIAAVEHAVNLPEEEGSPGVLAFGSHDLDTALGGAAFRREMRRVKAADAFAEIGAGRDGRGSPCPDRSAQPVPPARREASASDEPALRTTCAEAIPNVMFSVGRSPSE